jgi:hypothetical protein
MNIIEHTFFDTFIENNIINKNEIKNENIYCKECIREALNLIIDSTNRRRKKSLAKQKGKNMNSN